MLDSGTLGRYINEYFVIGLTSNPTILDSAISKSSSYDAEIGRLSSSGLSDEEIFFERGLHDLVRAADLFTAVHQRTAGNDGFVSLELSPLIIADTRASIAAAKDLYGKVNCPNLFIKIPGTKEGNIAIEESIVAGVPINVTLLFSLDQYLASAEAYVSGLERRIAAGLSPDIRSVASVFLSRWDRAVADKIPADLQNKLGIAVGQQIYRGLPRHFEVRALAEAGQLWSPASTPLIASTGTKDPNAPDILYITAMAASNTINTMPENTLLAFHDHGVVPESLSRTRVIMRRCMPDSRRPESTWQSLPRIFNRRVR